MSLTELLGPDASRSTGESIIILIFKQAMEIVAQAEQHCRQLFTKLYLEHIQT